MAAPTDVPLVVATDVVVRFGAVHALDGCSVTLPERGSVALIGENGSGKSTLLDVLCGFVPVTSGQLTDGAGRRLSAGAFRAMAARLHQRLVVPVELSVREYLAVCARPSRAGRLGTARSFFSDPVEPAGGVRELVSAVGIDDLETTIGELSFGQQRIVALSAIVTAPKRIVLLDEPFAGIVDSLCDLVMDVIVDAARQRLVIFAEHDLRYAVRAARLLVLKAGHVADELDPATVSETSLMTFYGN